MADHYPARITIGGPVTAPQVAALFGAITDDGAAIDLSQAMPVAAMAGAELTAALEALPVIDTAEDLARFLRTGPATPLVVEDNEATCGAFPAIEACCRTLGLTFCRTSDAYMEFGAGVQWWAPGMPTPAWTTGDQTGMPHVSVDAVRSALATATDPAVQLARLVALLDEVTPVDVPPLTLT